MPNIEPITYSNKGPLMTRLMVSTIEYMTGRFWMEYAYHDCLKKHDAALEVTPDKPFFTQALEYLNVNIEIASGALENIPHDRAVVVVANHPFGIVDGLMMNQIMYSRRKDYFILTNQVLLKAERMVPYLIPIDDSETPEGVAINKRSILQSMKHLKNDGAICVFPAGRLARPKSWGKPFEDLEWQELTAHLVTKVKSEETGKPPLILPMFFEGRNSTLFELAANCGAFTITRSLVINECKNKRGKSLRVHIGEPIAPEDIPPGLDHKALAGWMREQTLRLCSTGQKE